MGRIRRRPMHYTTFTLHDGTVLAAFPIRKPIQKVLKRDGRSVDPDGVVVEHTGAGREISDVQNENRVRSQNIIAVNLNARRALRDLVLPSLAETLAEVQALREQVQRIESLLLKLGSSSSAVPPSRS